MTIEQNCRLNVHNNTIDANITLHDVLIETTHLRFYVKKPKLNVNNVKGNLDIDKTNV